MGFPRENTKFRTVRAARGITKKWRRMVAAEIISALVCSSKWLQLRNRRLPRVSDATILASPTRRWLRRIDPPRILNNRMPPAGCCTVCTTRFIHIVRSIHMHAAVYMHIVALHFTDAYLFVSIATVWPTHSAPTPPTNPPRCSLPGCARPRFRDPATGRLHEYCGKGHAMEHRKPIGNVYV